MKKRVAPPISYFFIRTSNFELLLLVNDPLPQRRERGDQLVLQLDGNALPGHRVLQVLHDGVELRLGDVQSFVRGGHTAAGVRAAAAGEVTDLFGEQAFEFRVASLSDRSQHAYV